MTNFRYPGKSTAEDAFVTKDEIAPFLNKPVRVTLDDKQVYAGILEERGEKYAVRNSGPVKEQQDVEIDNAGRITDIEDAADDPAAAG